MTLLLWPAPSSWDVKLDRRLPWWSVLAWSVQVGPLELRRWGGPRTYRTPEERARLRGMVIGCVALTLAAAALVAAMWSTT